MTEQIQDQVSAFADDELSTEECEFLVRRLERDPEFRQKALRYAVIGASIRGEILAPDPDLLRRRVRAELGGIGTPARETLRERPATGWFIRPLAGFGIAATVAAFALFSLSNLYQPAVPGEGGLVARDTSVEAVSEPPSYVVPQETVAPVSGSPLAAPIRLTNYLVTHGEYASGLGRTSIHTNVVGNQGAWVVVTQEPEGD